MKKFIIILGFMTILGCVHKPEIIAVPEVKYVYVPIGQCDMGSFIEELKGLISEQDLRDLSAVEPQDRVKVLCELAANNQKLSVALQQLVTVLEQNQTDCRTTLDELTKKVDGR